MKNIITTEQIQEYFSDISKEFVRTISKHNNFINENVELTLLLNKINSNITAIIHLISIAMYNESCIIFRSLFETVVLFEYLVEFPSKIEQYKQDDLISEFHYLFLSYKRGLVPIEYLIEPYNILINDFQKIIPFEEKSDAGVITYNIKKIEEYFSGRRNSFKPLSQQTLKLISELLISKCKNKDLLYNLQIEFYNVFSQVSHNRLNTLLNPVKVKTDEKILKEIQEMYKNCILIYKIIIETLEDKYQLPYPTTFYKNIFKLGKYLKMRL